VLTFLSISRFWISPSPAKLGLARSNLGKKFRIFHLNDLFPKQRLPTLYISGFRRRFIIKITARSSITLFDSLSRYVPKRAGAWFLYAVSLSVWNSDRSNRTMWVAAKVT
jgi:hypothetical protein